jgi:hypothetical protein
MRNRQQTNADNLIAQNKSANSVRSQMNSLGSESKLLDNDIKVLQDTISSKTLQINALDMEILDKTSNGELANEIGPLKYLAKITGKSLDQVVNWFIIALMLVFDPLAIALVVAANFVFEYVANKKKEEEEKNRNERSVEDALELEKTKESVDKEVEEVEEQKFIIGEAPIPPTTEEIVEEPIFEEEYEVKLDEPANDSYFSEDYTKEEESLILEEPIEEEPEVVEEVWEPVVEEPVIEEIAEESMPEEQSTEEPVNSGEEGEFGGYRLGNVYKEEPKPRRQVFDEEQHVHQIDHPASSNPTMLN